MRKNKILALALTTILTMGTTIPTFAVTKIPSQEGSFNKAFSYSNGKYLYSGYKGDNETAVYFNDGHADNMVDSYDDYKFDNSVKYGQKYITMTDYDDTYFLDLSNGKILEDDLLQDKEDDIRAKLKTKLKKTDRYENTSTTDDMQLERVLPNKSGEVWYKYKAQGDMNVSEATNCDRYIGFVNEDGKYIDACGLAEICIYSTDLGDNIKFSNYGDNEPYNKNESAAIKLNDINVIAQDKDYLYTITNISFLDKEYDYFQKISKEQGDKKDDAFLPKTVESYVLDGYMYRKEGRKQSARNLLNQALDDALKGNSDSYVQVVDNNIYLFRKCDGTVKVNKLKFGKEKINTEFDNKNIDAPIVYNDDYKEEYNGQNAVRCMEEGVKASSIDINGNYWILNSGNIYKFENDKFEEKFTCDRSLDSLDVYDDENLIAWEDGGHCFAAVQNVQNSSGTRTENPKVKSGWYPNPDRTWSYYKDDVAVKSQWIQDENLSYVNANGIMVTGWNNIEGSWYYMDNRGIALTGWFNDRGVWYYLDSKTGAMLTDTVINGYTLGADGALVK